MAQNTARRIQRIAVGVSVAVSIVLLVVKLVAWLRTGSAAVLSDALESVVNVVAAGFAAYSISLAHRPADDNHPYGHGKVEFLSAAFEGGLIFLAGVMIIWEAIRRLIEGSVLLRLSEGIGLVAAAAVVNAVVGFWLIRVGRRSGSLTLIADGKHLLTDVLTSGFAIVGLLLVLLTDRVWIDPAMAILAALNILRMGALLLRDAVAGIMDEADDADLGAIADTLEALELRGVIRYSDVRSRHQGQLHHVDLTLWVDPGLTVEAADTLAHRAEAAISAALGSAEVLCRLRPASSAQHGVGAT